VVQVVSFAHEHELVGCEGESDGRVEGGTELVGSNDAAKKGDNNAKGGADAHAVTSRVLTFDHENDADEDEGANNLVGDDSQVHREFLIVDVVRFASHGVSWAQEGSSRVWLAEVSKV